MCDPFNTSIGAALWDECHDLDPFMAEHYATNAQHELDRLAASQPFSARIAHVRRLHAQYSALAATAQLPEDFDFEEPDSAERVEIEHMAFVHPDCLALMSSRRENIMPSSSHAQLSVLAMSATDVARVCRRSKTLSERTALALASTITIPTKSCSNGLLLLLVFFHPTQAVFQVMAGVFLPPGQHGGNTYHYAPVYTPVVVNNYYYGFAPPQQPQHGFDGDAGQGGPSGGSDVGRGRRGRGRGRRGGRAGN